MVYLLHQLLSESADRFPDKTALVFNNEKLTYAELERESNNLAHILLELGVKKGDRVGLYLNKSLDSIIGVLASLKAGAAYVPLNPLAPVSNLGYIINNCSIRLVLTQRDKLAQIEKAFPEKNPLENILVLDGLAQEHKTNGLKNVIDRKKLAGAPSGKVVVDNALDSDLAYILFTSGSTGKPKGVMITHRNSLTFVNAAFDFFKITSDDVLANHAPLHFDLSVFDLFVAFEAGASVAIVPETTSNFPSLVAEFIAKNGITVWNSVPSILSLLSSYANLGNYDLSHLRLILYAGEVFPIKYLRRLQNALPAAKIYNVYGQTEANSSTYYLINEIPADDKKQIPIGKTFPNFEVFALDEQGKRIEKPEVKGELYVRSTSVALGYWGDAEKTDKSFVKNPLLPHINERVYKTGDIVSLDSDGNYLFWGRKDHLIKSRGYRIEIGEIETALMNHPKVKNGVVIPIPDELIGNRIAAVVVPNNQAQLDKQEIIEHCHKHLTKYMIPEIIEFRSSLPTTWSGKTDRKTLLEELTAQLVSKTSFETAGV